MPDLRATDIRTPPYVLDPETGAMGSYSQETFGPDEELPGAMTAKGVAVLMLTDGRLLIVPPGNGWTFPGLEASRGD